MNVTLAERLFILNESVFFIQVLACLVGVRLARKMGKIGLTVLSALFAIFANFFVLKQISLFGMTVTCSDAFVIGSFVSLSLLQEKEGKEAALRATSLSFAAILLFTLFSYLHLLYEPAASDGMHSHYAAVLLPTPRLLVASLTAFFCAQRFHLSLLPYLGLSFSLLLSQALDTFLFTFLGLYGAVESISSIFWMSFGIKTVLIALVTPFQKKRHAV